MSCRPCELGWPLGSFIASLPGSVCTIHAEAVLFVRTGTCFAGSWQFLQRFVLALWWAAHLVINFAIQAGSGGQDMSLSDS